MSPFAQKSRLSVAGLLVAGGCVVGPAATAHAAPAGAGPVSSVRTDPAAVQAGQANRRAERTLRTEYQAQPNFYYCGPAATRIALSAQGRALSQDKVAKMLGTTEAGTDSALDTTRVLNELTGGTYKTTEIPDSVAKPEEVDRLRADVLAALDDGRPVVANIKGIAVDTEGTPHSYQGGHYLTLVGYRDGGDLIRIADPAAPRGEYWMTLEKVAHWIAERGYSH
ncbi:C39 family peptidase [Micromonospora sp. WMMA1363]|uniref:C39 family peptidase n=1 Tax=Micromonospora sp. WMMA1363 TaxID=3053985 RepID=UPI00259C7F60|nr:C39 family peptidase [Micromonospora sp. WMMA1363]MDM4722275.1 C39 family peptidase [Micromonospora sp. WMMA1363]